MKKVLIYLIIIVGLVALAYGALARFNTSVERPMSLEEQGITSPEMTKADWQKKVPEIKSLVTEKFPGERIEESRPISVAKNFNIKGLNGAFVYLGTGGASTEEVAVVVLVNGKLKVADLWDGATSRNNFLVGGSVTHSDVLDFYPSDPLVYTASATHFGQDSTCELKAYYWDKTKEAFVFNSEASKPMSAEYCALNKVEDPTL